MTNVIPLMADFIDEMRKEENLAWCVLSTGTLLLGLCL